MTTHCRTHSTVPSTYAPAGSYDTQSYERPELLRNTAYNGSEGFIGDSAQVVDPYQAEVQLSVPSRAVTPPRPALGARFLSSISNAQPAAAALTRRGSVLHSRAKSLAAFVPKLSTSNNSTPEKRQVPNKIFGDLFNGESAPIRIGPPVSPTKEREETEFVMDYRPSFTERPSSAFKRRGTGESITSRASVLKPEKPSWFSRKSTFSTPIKQTQDELANLNINAALFPNGPTDPLNPAAFNDLLLNATSLLQRMQVAYKEKVDYIASVKPEMDAQREEVEEAETRSKHLKMQLQDMGQQAQQQETAMQELSQQLTEEKIKVQEAREAAQTTRLVRRSRDGLRDENEETPRRRKRTSAGSASDSGFESDLDTVFSGHMSGAETPFSPPSSVAGSFTAGRDRRDWTLRPTKHRDELPSSSHNAKRLGNEGAAWATVEALRSENSDMKMQMEEMQRSLQGCIEFVSALNVA